MNKLKHHEHPEQMKVKYFSFGTKILTVIAGLGMTAFIYRFFVGLDVATNLDNQYPWGIWIAIDVASGVALAAGGFTTAALAEIFHREKYHSIIRPALLTAMLGYTFVAIGLLADLGRYYNIWHPMMPNMWSGNSVLFEVGICVMIYLTVLYIEFLPIVVERFKSKVNLPSLLAILNKPIELFLKIADKTLGRVTFIFIIAGVVLSCLHQSSLGTLMVIAPTKMHPLWYSPWSPLLFLLSAISVGFPMVIFESILASRSFKIKPEKKVLSSIAKYTPIILSVYFIIKVLDLIYRDALHYIWEGSLSSYSFSVEMLIGVIIPTIMLLNNKIRNNINGLFIAASMVIFGVVLNRINVYLVAYNPLYEIETYFPSVIEIAVTIGLISTLILVYRFVVIVFPVISIDGETKKKMENKNQFGIIK
ncbi:MAG: Ni/Fe-hydrogenase cytochrome b subunit [candidate division Zixibacteria bacterium]|nr:Ni/Fe-hydrogenase cytochrome b subunit [candidate division Zixibacteria bacterium]